jgi:hypothetical protein
VAGSAEQADGAAQEENEADQVIMIKMINVEYVD